MGNEALYLQQVMESHRWPTNVLAITSGKGGVGKTNMAANLAVCLAASQKKVLLVDADLAAKLGNGLAAQTDDDGFFKKVIDRFF